MKTVKNLVTLAMTVFLTVSALADVPKLINYQGRLTTPAGVPVPNATYSVTFTIYDAPTGGTNLWSEVQPVTTSAGQFSILLGSVTVLSNSIFSDTSRYLGVTVSPDPELAPRSRIVSGAYSYRVGTVDGATGGTITSKVTIGSTNINTGTNAFVAGANNRAGGIYSVVSGGGGALASDSNSATGNWSVIGGGYQNTASGDIATVGGGQSNVASGTGGATVVGGYLNTASGVGSMVGGRVNVSSGFASVVGGGAIDTASGDFSVVAGGYDNNASGIYASVGGGNTNNADAYSTVSGGTLNTATGTGASVGGGSRNTASGTSSTIAGGDNNAVVGVFAATVGGGQYDSAQGPFSTVPGGRNNTASGKYSFAAGRHAKANHDGAFVWADSTDLDFTSTATNQFLIRASGGVGIGTTSPAAGVRLDVNGAVKGNTFTNGANPFMSANMILQPEAGTSVIVLPKTNLTQFFQVQNDLGQAALNVDVVNRYVGIGTGSPLSDLHLESSNPISTNVRIFNTSATGDPNISFLSDGVFQFTMGVDNDESDKFQISSGSTLSSSERLTIINTGNVGIGTTSPAYKLEVSGAVMMEDAAAPSASAGHSGVYSSSGELRAFDAAGNSTQISPHDSETGEWIFYSKNVKTGRVVRVNMEKLVLKIEELTGEQFLMESWEK